MSVDRFDELMREARSLPDGPTCVAVLEEAVREADRLGDERRAYFARRKLVDTATSSGCNDRALVAFSWCLGYADRLGDDFWDLHSLLWAYKWIAGFLVIFPNVPRAQIEEIEADLGRRLDAHGFNKRPWWKIRWSNAYEMGELERARECCEKWAATPRDSLSDCLACDLTVRSRLHFALREDRAGIDHLAPVLEGRESCESVPNATLGDVLRPLVRLGRPDDALAEHRRGYPMVRQRHQHLDTVGDHLLFLVHVQNWDKALRLVERHTAWSLASHEPDTRFSFDLAAWTLFERLAERGDRPRKLRLPESIPGGTDDDRRRPTEVAAWFEARTRDLQSRFDARNGTNRYVKRIEESHAFAAGEAV